MISRRNLALLLVLVLLAAIFIVYSDTFRSMTSVWFASDSYVHGVLVLPMSAYLIWQQRTQWLRVTFSPAISGMLLLLVSVLAWSVASLVSVQLVGQLAFVAMIGAMIWSVLGTKVSREIHFPLLYAFFAVPFGEFLIPLLMDWTADVTVFALQVTGIPILREGHFFSLPSGNFQVIEACSGIRFLIVTVVLGLFFAHEAYKSWTKRAIFMAFAALLTIAANWARAYIVVLTAHLTDMKYGTGQSHIYIGWVIFLLVITILFWFGRRYEDTDNDVTPGGSSTSAALQDDRVGRRGDVVIAAVIALGILASGPILLQAGRERISEALPQPALPIASGYWSGPQATTLDYQPALVGASDVLAGQYNNGSKVVELHIIFYSEQQQGNELVGWQSKLFDPEKWHRVRQERVSADNSPTYEGPTVQSILISDDRRILQLWYWYDIGGSLLSSPRAVKVRQAWNAIKGNGQGDALIVLVTPATDRDNGIDISQLERFVRDNLATVRSCLRPSSSDGRTCVTPPIQFRSPER